jgi:hypothetical protein
MIMEILTDLNVDVNMEINVKIKNWGVRELTGFKKQRVGFGDKSL